MGCCSNNYEKDYSLEVQEVNPCEDRLRYDDGFDGSYGSVVETSKSKLKGNVCALISFFTSLLSVFTMVFAWFGFIPFIIVILFACVAKRNNSSFKLVIVLSLIVSILSAIVCFYYTLGLYPEVKDCLYSYLESFKIQRCFYV